MGLCPTPSCDIDIIPYIYHFRTNLLKISVIFDIIYKGEKMKNKNLKEMLIGIGVVLSYFIYSYFQIVPLTLVGIDCNSLSISNKVIYLLITEFIYLIILFVIFKKTFQKHFKKFKDNFKNYFKNYMQYWALAFSLMLISNFIILSLFPNSVATNQEIVTYNFMVAPAYMFISAVIFAPFLEETIFRLGFRKIFKNDILFIIMSGLVFGGLHVINSFENLVDLIYIIPYSIPGFVFAYTLVKSKNIFVPIGLHFFHNGIMMTIQMVLLFFL